MDETKIIYHVNDEDTPYLIKLPISADKITLGDLKNALNRPNCKYYFKSMDDDFGVVKEEIGDDLALLPCFNGRVVSWLVVSDSSVSDTHSQCTESVVGEKSLTEDNNRPSPSQKTKDVRLNNVVNSEDADSRRGCRPPPDVSRSLRDQMPRPQNLPPRNHGHRRSERHRRAHDPSSSSVMSSDIETTTFIDSDDDDDDDTSSRITATTETTAASSRYGHLRQQRRRRQRLPIMTRASSFSSITDSTMSLNIVTVTLNLDIVKFLGISIVGQSNKGGDGGIYVGSIMKGGAVALDGRIEPGDMILEVNDLSFENMSNDEAVRVLREVVQKNGPVKLVVAKCWDPNPKGYFVAPPQEPIRPIDPSAWIAHTEAVRSGAGGIYHPMGGGVGGPGRHPFSTMTMTSTGGGGSSISGSIQPDPELYLHHPYVGDKAIQSLMSDRTSGGSYRSFSEMCLSVQTDLSVVAKAMARPDSGLEIRDRMWLKITIPHAFIGSDLIDWLLSNVRGLIDRRDGRKYANNLLRAGFIRHTVNKVTFSEQCYYTFGDILATGQQAEFNYNPDTSDFQSNLLPTSLKNLSTLTLEDIDSVSEVNRSHSIKYVPSSAWINHYAANPYGPTAQTPIGYAPPPPYNLVTSERSHSSGSNKRNEGGGGGGGVHSGSGSSASGSSRGKKSFVGGGVVSVGDLGDSASVLSGQRYSPSSSGDLVKGRMSSSGNASQQSFNVAAATHPYENLEIMGDL